MDTKNTSSLNLESGFPRPFGTSLTIKGVNFSFYGKNSNEFLLTLYKPEKKEPFFSGKLNPNQHRTGNVWHAEITNLPANFDYIYTLDGSNTPIIDPFAKHLASPRSWGDPKREWRAAHREMNSNQKFPFRPKHPTKELIIYEMHLRGFTKDPSSKVKHPGTFLGLIEKIPYLKKLGINAIELLPVMEFDEREYHPTEQLWQYWGYSPLHFFAPMGRYTVGNSAEAPALEFQQMVRACHQAGIEVILDVVYNHSGEKESCNFKSLKKIDEEAFFILDANNNHTNYTGCGNTLSANHPLMTQLIQESIRYWHLEMGVDGFRFDLASSLRRDPKGTPLAYAPVLQNLAEDPLLEEAKLIAEPWDPGGLYDLGFFSSSSPRWSEWNGRYRDSVRRFLNGQPGMSSHFATALCGSPDLYSGRNPWNGVNFVTSHDGFTLTDLVTYNQKHNLNNGEDNKDGSNHNDSWNCGIEGPTDDPEVLRIRERLRLNYILALLLSQGVPMLRMGDEYGHTQKGNNNSWCQDNLISWFTWNHGSEGGDFFKFLEQMIAYRKKITPLIQEQFFNESMIHWHNKLPHQPKWDPESRIVAFTLSSSIYVAFNSHHYPVEMNFPFDPKAECWKKVVDTSLPSKQAFSPGRSNSFFSEKIFQLEPYSAILLEKENNL